MFSEKRRQLMQIALSHPPIEVSPDASRSVHTLLGTKGLPDAIFGLQCLLPHLPMSVSLVLHEDGSFTTEQIRLLQRQFPGCTIITRPEATRVVIGELEARRLTHCADFRRRSIMGLKLFDLQHFAAGRRALYLDTDILFYSRPDEIIAAFEEPDDVFVGRYNEDVGVYYSWTPEQVLSAVGVTYPRRPVNAGMVLIQKQRLDWERYEACFELPGRTFWDEQTLWAVEFGATGGTALAAEYDVCFRHAWAGLDRMTSERQLPVGRPVISQHFCGGTPYRQMYYREALARNRPSSTSR
jgi:hypothetical protein